MTFTCLLCLALNNKIACECNLEIVNVRLDHQCIKAEIQKLCNSGNSRCGSPPSAIT